MEVPSQPTVGEGGGLPTQGLYCWRVSPVTATPHPVGLPWDPHLVQLTRRFEAWLP